ncbi:MAG: GNVR domain-containing protein [Rikenellaceae bacterium]
MKSINKLSGAVSGISMEQISVKEIFTIFFRYRVWFIISMILMIALGLGYLAVVPTIYSRSAIVIVEDEGSGVGVSEATAFHEIFSMGASSVYNEIGLFRSNRLICEVVERLGLETSYRMRESVRMVDLYKSSPLKVSFVDILPDQNISFVAELLDNLQVKITGFVIYSQGQSSNRIVLDDRIVTFGNLVSTEYGGFVITPTLFMNDDMIGRRIYINRDSPKIMARNYLESLNVGMVDKFGSLISISIEDESISRADDIINTLIDVYRDDAVRDKNIILSNTTQFIEERLSIIEADLKAIDAEIERFKRNNNITDVLSEGNIYRESISRIDQENLNIENQLNMAQYMKSYLENEANISALLPVNIGIGDSGLQMQISQYNENMNQRNRMIVNSSVNNPLVIDLQNILAGMRSSILLSINNLIANLEIQARNISVKEVESLDKIKDIPSQQKYIVNIQRQQTIKEQLYLYLLNKKEESELQRSITESSCRVVDYAHGNLKPVSPNKIFILLFCIALGFIIPAILIYVIKQFNTMVMTRSDIKGVLQVPFLGDIPLQRGIEDNGIVVTEGSRDAVGEAFRIVRDNIDFMNIDSSRRSSVIQLTSFNPNSGKTFVSINLAMSMALGGAKVVLLDLDIRKGTLSKAAHIRAHQVGVSQYLSGKIADVNKIIGIGV